MKIGSYSPSVQAPQSAETNKRLEEKVQVLKRALESQEKAQQKMEKMIEPKGQVIDIRA